MKTSEIEKEQSHIVIELIQYVPNAVLSKTILKKLTGNITIYSFVTKTIITLIIILFSLLLNVGFSLWIGKQLGETYYGFFICAGLYLLMALVFYIFRYPWIKRPISNFIISKLIKK